MRSVDDSRSGTRCVKEMKWTSGAEAYGDRTRSRNNKQSNQTATTSAHVDSTIWKHFEYFEMSANLFNYIVQVMWS